MLRTSLYDWTCKSPTPIKSESGWNFKLRLDPLSSEEKVPIPRSVPTDMKGYWVIKLSVPSWAVKTWCRALVLPIETLTILLIVVSLDVVNPHIVPVDPILTNLDSNLPEFSDPSDWASNLNLYVPIPDAVVPKPTILDLTKTWFDLSFSYFKDKTPESISDVNVPIEFPVLLSNE